MRVRTALILSAFLLGLASAAGRAQGGDAAKLSPAQVALFASDHLRDISKPVVLRYAFRHDGGAEQQYSDKIALRIEAVRPDGKKDVAVDFLSGERHLPFSPVSDFGGNPLLMYFLQYDVMAMHRATGGGTSFFRNRIRDAFLGGAEMHAVKIALDGQERDATEIVIHPYAKVDIPAMARYAGKSYSFFLSAAVPGMLYRIESELPKTADAPAVTESVTFAGAGP